MIIWLHICFSHNSVYAGPGIKTTAWSPVQNMQLSILLKFNRSHPINRQPYGNPTRPKNPLWSRSQAIKYSVLETFSSLCIQNLCTKLASCKHISLFSLVNNQRNLYPLVRLEKTLHLNCYVIKHLPVLFIKWTYWYQVHFIFHKLAVTTLADFFNSNFRNTISSRLHEKFMTTYT